MSQTETLSTQTQQALQDFMSSLPENDQQTVGAAFEKLMTSDAGDNAPKEGDQAPDFALPNVHGANIQLSELLKKGPVVLNFYRGGWCPFCNLEFKALSDIMPQITAKGACLLDWCITRTSRCIAQHHRKT